jgi:hypothetical protein
MFAAARQAPVQATMQHFHLRIFDLSGAVVETTEVGIGQLGDTGVNQVATLHADKDGRVTAALPPGDYVAILSAHGYENQTLHFVISNAGDSAERTVTLLLGHT